jgi:type IV secretory pathway TraG/TraD family ATPase VirD4
MPNLLLPSTDLNSHVAIFADTGAGKGLFLKQYLQNVERAGEVAVVWDPDREYARAFRSVDRGDWILDPGVMECPYWPIAEEVEDEADALALATCQFPDVPNAKDPFWNMAARQLYAYLLAYKKPTTAQLGYWMAHDSIIDRMVRNTEFATQLTNNAPGMRASIIGHLNTAAQSLRMMPIEPSENHRALTIREWCATREGWIFLTSSPLHMQAMKPLHSMWMAMLIKRTMHLGRQTHLPRLHFVFDEASTITVDDFHTALVRLRKTDCPVVYAIQNFSDLKATYGDKALSIYSQAYTQIIGRTKDNESSLKLADTLGKITVKRLNETREYSHKTGRHSRTYSTKKEKEYLIDPEDIQNLDNRELCLFQPGVAVRFKAPIIDPPDRLPAIQERKIPPMEHRALEPDALGEEEPAWVAPEPELEALP